MAVRGKYPLCRNAPAYDRRFVCARPSRLSDWNLAATGSRRGAETQSRKGLKHKAHEEELRAKRAGLPLWSLWLNSPSAFSAPLRAHPSGDVSRRLPDMSRCGRMRNMPTKLFAAFSLDSRALSRG